MRQATRRRSRGTGFRATGAVCAAIGLLLLPGTSAGSQADPELTDPTGDVRTLQDLPMSGPIADRADIVAAWVGAENETHVELHLQVASMAPIPGTQSPPWIQFSYSVNVATSNVPTKAVFDYAWLLQARHFDEGSGPQWVFECFSYIDEPACNGILNGRPDTTTTSVVFEVPKSILHDVAVGDELHFGRDAHTTATGIAGDFAGPGSRNYTFQVGPAVPPPPPPPTSPTSASPPSPTASPSPTSGPSPSLSTTSPPTLGVNSTTTEAEKSPSVALGLAAAMVLGAASWRGRRR